MICDFLASFTRREEKRPDSAKTSGHASAPVTRRDHGAVGPAPEGLPHPTEAKTLP